MPAGGTGPLRSAAPCPATSAAASGNTVGPMTRSRLLTLVALLVTSLFPLATAPAGASTADPSASSESRTAATPTAPPARGPILFAAAGAPAPPASSDLLPTLPLVGSAPTPGGSGAWLVASDGGIFSYGDAEFHGSMGGLPLNRPMVGLTGTVTGEGYWTVASDGGIFSFGDATFYGSMGGLALNRPIVGMAATASGHGYWLVASDGGIFAFGDAGFFGSRGSEVSEDLVAGMAVAPDGEGYWIVSEGGKLNGYGSVADTTTTVAGDGTVVALTPVGSGVWLARQRVGPSVAVFQSGDMTRAALTDILAAASAAGARTTVVHRGTLGVLSFSRDGRIVDAASRGFRLPFTAMAIDPRGAAPFVGGDVASAVTFGGVVLSAGSAALRDARVGDVVTFVGWDNQVHRRRIDAVVPDDRVGSELTFSTADARSFGLIRPASVWIWDIGDAPALERGLATVQQRNRYVGIGRSWDPADPDGVLSSVELKRAIGEVEFRPGDGDAVTLDPAWVSANIRVESIPVVGRVRCQKGMLADLRAAFAEIQAKGLASLIDVADTGRYGGCYVPRLIRGPSGGSLSRHAYGIAFDMNPSSNPFGGTPTLDARLVAIFRAHGFAWGGTWTRPDGMHVEWLGPRST
jgi:D-alanyl-D-alanine carboxypeptidase